MNSSYFSSLSSTLSALPSTSSRLLLFSRLLYIIYSQSCSNNLNYFIFGLLCELPDDVSWVLLLSTYPYNLNISCYTLIYHNNIRELYEEKLISYNIRVNMQINVESETNVVVYYFKFEIDIMYIYYVEKFYIKLIIKIIGG